MYVPSFFCLVFAFPNDLFFFLFFFAVAGQSTRAVFFCLSYCLCACFFFPCTVHGVGGFVLFCGLFWNVGHTGGDGGAADATPCFVIAQSDGE